MMRTFNAAGRPAIATGFALFYLMVEVNARGCFIPQTLVSLADGTQRPISNIVPGDVLLSWDEDTATLATAEVTGLTRVTSSDLSTILLEDGITQITSTRDHPFWSHEKRAIVSLNPRATERDYNLSTSLMGMSETFAHESGVPLRGYVKDNDTKPNSKDDSLQVEHEVMTLCLNRHHWFFVHGIRTHNKGCFLPSTPVTLADGTQKHIEAIVEGDMVMSWDDDANLSVSSKVLEVMYHWSSDLIDVQLGNKTVTSTRDHPYLSRDRGLVSRDPGTTERDYRLKTEMMADDETFVDQYGKSVNGTVTHRNLSILGPDSLELPKYQVVTLVLKLHHWFFVHGIRVHNKGCFVPSTLVTLGDGSHKAIGDIAVGDVVMSWNHSEKVPTNSTVASVLRARSSELVDVIFQDSAERLTSTDDHPYWSHGKQQIVSLNPDTTRLEYELPVVEADGDEVLMDSFGLPVHTTIKRRQPSPAFAQIDDGCISSTDCEVVTLSLDEHHWFFAQGVLVHNKIGRHAHTSGVVAENQCCCLDGMKWNTGTQKCEPCPNLERHFGEDCLGECFDRAGPCPHFCGKSGKCCRAGVREPNDVVGGDSCGWAEGTSSGHRCVGEGPKGLHHEGARCLAFCDNQGGRCDWCGSESFCCKFNSKLPNDKTGADACKPEEGGLIDHICVGRNPSCDLGDVIPHVRVWKSCPGPNQEVCHRKVLPYCCCDKGWKWNEHLGKCEFCTSGEDCSHIEPINSTLSDFRCHPSFHLHQCSRQVPSASFMSSSIVHIGLLCVCCVGVCVALDRGWRKMTVQRCMSERHNTILTRWDDEIARNPTFAHGWQCNSCGKRHEYSMDTFARCTRCNLDYCNDCINRASDLQLLGVSES